MPRFFQKDNADRPVMAAGKRHVFEVTSRSGGTSFGIVAVDDRDVIDFLAAAPGVEEITAEAYAARTKIRIAPAYPTHVQKPGGPAMKGSGRAEVVDGFTIARPNMPVKMPDTINDAIQLGTATLPSPDVPQKTKRKR